LNALGVTVSEQSFRC